MSLGDEDGYGSDAGRTSDAYSTIGGTRQTRTRLPDGPAGDAYGPRRPVRNSRSLITFVGVVVLLLGAIAFANMGGDDGSGGKSGSGTNDKTGAAPTAATGTKPVTGKTGIIPSGFAHDQQGRRARRRTIRWRSVPPACSTETNVAPSQMWCTRQLSPLHARMPWTRSTPMPNSSRTSASPLKAPHRPGRRSSHDPTLSAPRW